MIDIRDYERLALESSAFLDIEIEILKETLKAWDERPGQVYTLAEIRDGKQLAGFCLYQRAPNTDFTIDIHSFIVDRDYRSKGVGMRLLAMVEEELLNRMGSALLRVEISRTKEWAIEPEFFNFNGFDTIGHIPDFYEADNDYFIYAKHVRPPEPEKTESETTEESAPADASTETQQPEPSV